MILVTGGAGYIGSHTIHQLMGGNRACLALDNLYSGHRWAVPKPVELVEGNTGDVGLVEALIQKYKVESVIHFAAHLNVGESAEDPLKYYRNNFLNSLNLIETCSRLGVKHFVFSSTCAVYGTPDRNPVDENVPVDPVSPYGRSKLATEWLLRDLEAAKTGKMRSVILRYFNVAGAKVSGGLGQATPNASQLIKLACEVAVGKRDKLSIFGTDYPTPDGTCVRDYIHVDDLAQVHLLALDYLEQGGESQVFNCGYGSGYSVKEVIEMVKKLSGNDFKVESAPRRPGDSVAIYADVSKVKRVLKWKPQYDSLETICRTALSWEKICP